MAWSTAENRMVLAYDNRVRPDYVSAVTAYNASTPGTPMPTLAGYPVDALKYDDPWTMMKASDTPTHPSHRRIEFDFGATARSFNCVGLLNHNLFSQGYKWIALYAWVSGSTWAQVGGGNLNFGTVVGDPEVLLRFESGTSSQKWRVEFSVLSGNLPTFSLGAVFLGTYVEMERNPLDNGMFFTAGTELTMTEGLGGARIIGQRAPRMNSHAELSFQRVPGTTVKTVMELVQKKNVGRLVAVIPPELVSQAVPSWQQHFFGYLTQVVYSPRGGATSSLHRYDMTMMLEGCT